MKLAILDDYQNIALEMAGCSTVTSRAEISIFNDHIAGPAAVVERLLPFDVIRVNRTKRAAADTSKPADASDFFAAQTSRTRAASLAWRSFSGRAGRG